MLSGNANALLSCCAIDRCCVCVAGAVKDDGQTVDVSKLPAHLAPVAMGGGASSASAAASASGADGAAAALGEMSISAPFEVKHNVHVQIDPSAPSGYKGLPPQWESMLSASGITKAQIEANPREVLDVLNFHMKGGAPPALPKKALLGL